MPRLTTWNDLKVGLAATAILAAIVASILLFARVGAIRGERFTLYVIAPEATGVLKGTEVWVAGQKVGRVTEVNYLPSSGPAEDRILISTEIRARDFPLIRRDSRADLRPGGNLIGSPVIFLTAGTASARPVRNGDTLKVKERAGMAGITTTLSGVGTEMSGLVTDVSRLVQAAKSPAGTTGTLLDRGMPSLTGTSAEFTRLKNRATGGNGTVGLAMKKGIIARTSAIMASVDSVKAMLATGNGNVGRFRRDSTLSPTIKGLMARVDTLRALASDPAGSMGRARSDSTLSRELARARLELAALIKDIKRHPVRYIAF